MFFTVKLSVQKWYCQLPVRLVFPVGELNEKDIYIFHPVGILVTHIPPIAISQMVVLFGSPEPPSKRVDPLLAA